MIAVPMACWICKKSKRRCDKKVPCSRCTRLGRADECVRGVEEAPCSKKRDKTESLLAQEDLEEESFETITLEAQTSVLVSMLLSHSQNVLRERPGDAMVGLGLNMENVLVIEINPMKDRLPPDLLVHTVGEGEMLVFFHDDFFFFC